MEITKKFEKIQQDIFVLEKTLLQDLHRLLKTDFSNIQEDTESEEKYRLEQFLDKGYDFEKYNSYLSELLEAIENLERSSKRLPEVTENLRATKKEYESKKAMLTDTNYELGLIRENCLAELNSLNREYQMSLSLDEELENKLSEEDNRQKRKIAEINKLNMEIQNIKQKSVAQSNLIKKGEIEREAQMMRLKNRLVELAEIAEKEEADFQQSMEEKEVMAQELQRKIVLVDKEIELLKDMESLKGSSIRF